MKAMILAAGRGSRMMPLTANTPKPLLKVNGKPLIQHLIEMLAESGITELVINHSYLGEKIEQAMGDGSQLGVNIQYSPEKSLLGTGGGIVNALPLLGDEAFVLVNSDVWTDYPFSRLPALDGSSHLAHLVVVDNVAHNPAGDFVMDGEVLLSRSQPSITEFSTESRTESQVEAHISELHMPELHLSEGQQQSTVTYSGIAVFHPEFFKGLKVSTIHLLPLLAKAMSKNLVSGERYQGRWVDVGTPERLKSL